MKLSNANLNSALFQEKNYTLPRYDRAQVLEKTAKTPVWVHMGAGNIARSFVSQIAQDTLDAGKMDTGLIICEGFDYEIIEKAYRPYDNLCINVILNPDGSVRKNVVGSLTILTSRPFRVGDHVQIGEQSGIVREIGMTYTCIETFSGQTVYLPNSSASTACIVNYSEQGRRRLDIDVAASYEDDAEAVKAALLRAADCSYRLADTPTFVGIKSYADSGILYELQLWVKSDEYLSARFAVNEAVKRCFEEDGISFPYPHVELVTK